MLHADKLWQCRHTRSWLGWCGKVTCCRAGYGGLVRWWRPAQTLQHWLRHHFYLRLGHQHGRNWQTHKDKTWWRDVGCTIATPSSAKTWQPMFVRQVRQLEDSCKIEIKFKKYGEQDTHPDTRGGKKIVGYLQTTRSWSELTSYNYFIFHRYCFVKRPHVQVLLLLSVVAIVVQVLSPLHLRL